MVLAPAQPETMIRHGRGCGLAGCEFGGARSMLTAGAKACWPAAGVAHGLLWGRRPTLGLIFTLVRNSKETGQVTSRLAKSNERNALGWLPFWPMRARAHYFPWGRRQTFGPPRAFARAFEKHMRPRGYHGGAPVGELGPFRSLLKRW